MHKISNMCTNLHRMKSLFLPFLNLETAEANICFKLKSYPLLNVRMKEIILTEMNSTKSVCLHIPDLPCNSNGNTAIATSAFSPGKEKGAISV